MITLANIRRAIYNICKRLDIVDKEQNIIKERQDNTYNKGEVDLLLSNKANNSINELIPAQASSDNLLADKNFVNSSVSTATATYRGCYNLVSDLSLTTLASHGQIETALATAVSDTPDNNDYAFVQIPTDDTTPTEIASVERYKFNGTLWSFEYTLNNSGFTAAQWAAVNSNITSGLVAKLNDMFGTTRNSIANLFGMDASGNFQNISTSDLASALGVDFKYKGETHDTRYLTSTGIYYYVYNAIGIPSGSERYGVIVVFNAYIFIMQLLIDSNSVWARRSDSDTMNFVNRPWIQLG